jgi:transposase
MEHVEERVVRSANIVVAISDKVARDLGQKTISEKALASELGVSIATIRGWKKKTELSGRQIANLVLSVKKTRKRIASSRHKNHCRILSN